MVDVFPTWPSARTPPRIRSSGKLVVATDLRLDCREDAALFHAWEPAVGPVGSGR